MPVRLGRFEMPKRLIKEETTATETYAKFIAEPFETGYGHTIGNSLRRVLLSSLEGAAITSVKIDGAMHEFTTDRRRGRGRHRHRLEPEEDPVQGAQPGAADAAAVRQQGRRR